MTPPAYAEETQGPDPAPATPDYYTQATDPSPAAQTYASSSQPGYYGAQTTASYAAAPAYSAPTTRPSRVPLAIAIVALLAVIACFAMAWYTLTLAITLPGFGAVDLNFEFGLLGCTITAQNEALGCSEFTAMLGGMGTTPALPMPASAGFMAIGALMMLIGTARGFRPTARKGSVGGLLLGGSLLVMLAPILLVVTAGTAFSSGFLGQLGGSNFGPATSFSGAGVVPFGPLGNLPAHWGPSAGFYAPFVAGIIGLIAGALVLAGKPGPVPVTAPFGPGYGAAYGQQGYPGYYGYQQASYAQTAGAGSTPATKACIACGTLNWSTSAVCGKCGAAFAQAAAQPSTKDCLSCGTLNWATSAVCGKCGAPFAAAARAPPVTQAAPARQQPATKTCPTCGTLNWATSALCGKCGASMAVQAQAAAPAQRATKKCPACGRLNWATSATCGQCGATMGP